MSDKQRHSLSVERGPSPEGLTKLFLAAQLAALAAIALLAAGAPLSSMDWQLANNKFLKMRYGIFTISSISDCTIESIYPGFYVACMLILKNFEGSVAQVSSSICDAQTQANRITPSYVEDVTPFEALCGETKSWLSNSHIMVGLLVLSLLIIFASLMLNTAQLLKPRFPPLVRIGVGAAGILCLVGWMGAYIFWYHAQAFYIFNNIAMPTIKRDVPFVTPRPTEHKFHTAVYVMFAAIAAVGVFWGLMLRVQTLNEVGPSHTAEESRPLKSTKESEAQTTSFWAFAPAA